MARTLVGINGTKIGAYMFPDRKRPALCVEKGNTITVFGYFQNKARAELFMHELAQAVGAIEETKDGGK